MKRKQSVVPYRRKREGKTNYNKRIALVASGKPRLVVRVTGTKIIAQIIKFEPVGDVVIAAMDSNSLKKEGWSGGLKNISTGYAVGLALAKKATSLKQKEAVLDIGFHTSLPGSRIYAVLKGAVDGGLEIPHDPEMFPTTERIEGKKTDKKKSKELDNKKETQ